MKKCGRCDGQGITKTQNGHALCLHCGGTGFIFDCEYCETEKGNDGKTLLVYTRE